MTLIRVALIDWNPIRYIFENFNVHCHDFPLANVLSMLLKVLVVARVDRGYILDHPAGNGITNQDDEIIDEECDQNPEATEPPANEQKVPSTQKAALGTFISCCYRVYLTHHLRRREP